MPPSSHPVPPRRRPREEDTHPHPKPWERGLTLDEGVSWMIANEAGLNGRPLAQVGRAAHGVLRLLRAAAEATSGARRRKLAQRTAAALAKLDPKTRAALTQPVQDRLAELTTGQDRPRADTAAQETGPSVNPETGVQEFAAPIWPPPKPGHKPDPNMPADEKARLVRDADHFRGYSKLYGDAFSFASVDAPHNPSLTEKSMRHFLGSSGRDRYIDPAELRKFDTITKAEEENRKSYADLTFGDWQPQKDFAKLEKAKLDAIEDGQAIQLRDRWPSPFTAIEAGVKNFDPDLAASIGGSSLVTDGTFHVTRRGNELDVTGNVVHGIDDSYDFVDGAKEFDKSKFQAERAQRLIDGGFAETYRNRSRWSQPMNATVEILPDGKRRVKQIEWGEVSPYQWKVGD